MWCLISSILFASVSHTTHWNSPCPAFLWRSRLLFVVYFTSQTSQWKSFWFIAGVMGSLSFNGLSSSPFIWSVDELTTALARKNTKKTKCLKIEMLQHFNEYKMYNNFKRNIRIDILHICSNHTSSNHEKCLWFMRILSKNGIKWTYSPWTFSFAFLGLVFCWSSDEPRDSFRFSRRFGCFWSIFWEASMSDCAIGNCVDASSVNDFSRFRWKIIYLLNGHLSTFS